MFCGFFISADYAIVRPASHSIFIHYHGVELFPYVWLLSVPMSLAFVSLYNYFLSRLGCLKMFFVTAGTIILGNVLVFVFIDREPWVSFVFYLWKDAYVMLMFQQLWSVIHTHVEQKKARFLYGIIFGIGALGGFAGSMFTRSFAVELGSETLLLSTAPLYVVLGVLYYAMLKNAMHVEQKIEKEVSTSLWDSVKVIRESRLLLCILGMVTFMQLAAALTDFQFSTLLSERIPEKDLRTAYLGKLLSYGNILTMTFQFVGTYILIHFLGLYRSHLLVPVILGTNALFFIAFPSFGLMSYNFIVLKCLDFSLFSVIKEMLYIPLGVEQKFRAKAIIDVFMYRGAKVLASAGILGLQFALPSLIIPLISWMNIAIFLGWGFVVGLIKYSYQPTEQKA